MPQAMRFVAISEVSGKETMAAKNARAILIDSTMTHRQEWTLALIDLSKVMNLSFSRLRDRTAGRDALEDMAVVLRLSVTFPNGYVAHIC